LRGYMEHCHREIGEALEELARAIEDKGGDARD
jgi:hypothetical protein